MKDTVVVVGGGPVGLMAACELGLAGVRTVVLERLDEPDECSFGMAINPAVVELLDQRGILETLAGEGMSFPMAHFAHIPLDPVRLGGEHPHNFAVPQSRLSARLAERAVELGVEIRRGVEVVGLEQDPSRVVLRTSTGDDLVAEYVVGCDGAGSAVRGMVGVEFAGTDLPFAGITGDVETGHEDQLFQLLGPHQYSTGFVTVAPSGPNVVRVTTGEFDVDAPDPASRVDLAHLLAAIERISGIALPTSPSAVRWLSRWTAPTRQASRYREGRVFLAGDAAHVHFPLGGLSLSSGIEDAVNLGWKLAATVHGWGQADLLDTYHTERHPVGARACAVTRAQVALLHPMDTVSPLRSLLAELVQFDSVNSFLVKLVGGLDQPDAPLVGRRLPDLALKTPDGETSLARLLRSGEGLLLVLDEVDVSVAGWEDRVSVVRADSATDLGTSAVLLRPDGRVAWDSSTSDLPAALRRWFGEPC